MALGIYPFRCLGCNRRVWVNVWLFSQLRYAKCPNCLGHELTNWPRSHYRVSVWSNLLMTFGAHRYRCAGCRYNFLSFRPRQGPRNAGAETAKKETMERDSVAQKAGAIPESEDPK
jgi:DNA-directed RNA polymerase subunit RPC12/RpoP